MLHAASHDIGARNANEFYWSRPSFGNVASVASHGTGTKNRLKFFDVNQALEMLWVPLVTMLAWEVGLKFFWRHQALEILRMPLVTKLVKEMRLKCFWSRPNFADVASAASHDIGARNLFENFLKSTKVWRCCLCRQSRYWSEKSDWNFFEVEIERGEERDEKKERSLEKRWTERWMINNSKIVDWTKSLSPYQMSIYFCFPKKLCERREMDRKMEAIERSNWRRQK